MEIHEHYAPIPERLWSFETGKPFQQCSLCGCELIQENKNYFIEKAFLENETIFELALCLDCHLQCMEEVSAESLERIGSYFSEHTHFDHRLEHGLKHFGIDPERWISHCMVKGYPTSECGEYQLYAYCIDRNLVFNGAPYMLSGEVLDEIVDLLSPATLGSINDLSERLFGIDAPKDLLIL